MGCGGRGGTKGKERNLVWKEKGPEEEVLARPFYPDSHLPPRNKKMQTLEPGGATDQQMTPLFYLLVGGQ